MKRRMALFTGYGMSARTMPEEIKRQMIGDYFTDMFVTLVEIYDSLDPIEDSKDFNKHSLKLLENKENEGMFRYEDRVFFKAKCKYFSTLSYYSIVEVETNRPWRIVNYNGRETIEYFDELRKDYNKINAEYGFAKAK